MKFLLVVVFCVFAFASTFAFVDDVAEPCVSEKCKLEDGCVCSSSRSPLPTEETPQFVTITFDDSVLNNSYYNHYSRLLFGRKNADGSPISATFYVPHLYTDYEAVNNLFNNGFEIGVNSISKGTAEYFANLSLKGLIDEFDGQRTIISKFANIPKEHIIGARTPHFYLTGDKSFEAYKTAGLVYDHSWVALSNQHFFPYSLHYRSSQPSVVGEKPISSFPSQWVIPVNNFLGKYNKECNVLLTCEINGTALEIGDWLINNYNKIKSGARAPINLLLNTAWFEIEGYSLLGLERFLDHLGKQTDTFIVSHQQLLNWAKKPDPLAEYKPVINHPTTSCLSLTCPLIFGDQTMYMRSCIPCPNVYPWLTNPEGN